MNTPPSRLILLTGASGFIGSAFLQHALAVGWRVRALTRHPQKFIKQDDLEIFEGDLLNTLDWRPALEDVQIVVHTAAELTDVGLMHDLNVQGSSRLLESAMMSGVCRWVQLSSVGAYGPVLKGLVTEEWPDRPTGAYEKSKADFDAALKRVAQQGDMEICIVRPSNVYGTHMRNQSIHQLVSIIRKGWFAYVGPPGASANYVHVDDVVQALHLCVTHPKAANQTYIVSAWATMEDMVNALCLSLGMATPKKRVGIGVAKWLAARFQRWRRWPLTISRVQAMCLRSQYSTQKIENELGWKVSVPVPIGMSQISKSATK